MKIVIALMLCVLTVAVYARTAWYPFSCNDDPDYVTQNIHVSAGLSIHSIRWAFSSFHAANWHPLTWLSLMLDAQLFGSNPAGFHLVNVLFHVANTSFLFYLFIFMTGAIWRSAFVAALFALHPLHVESVVWITERKDVLSTLFWLATLFFYAAYVKRSDNRLYLLSLVAFALGLMAKPMLVTIPVVLMLLDIWPLERPASRRCILDKLPFFALSAAMSVVTMYAQRQTVATITGLPLGMRIANALWSTLLYAAKMLVPVKLSAYYPFVPVPYWKACVAACLLGIVLNAAIKLRRTHPYVAVGLCWYLVTLLPVIGLIQVGGQAMADRYTYVPLIGLFIMASWGIGDLAGSSLRAQRIVSLAAGGALAVYIAITCVQVHYWKDDKTLFSHALAVTQENSFAHNALGGAYVSEGNGVLAVKEFRESLRIDPDDSAAHRNLGLVLDKQLGKPAEAIEQYEIAARLNTHDPVIHYLIAKALVNMGKMREAVAEYNKALEMKPDDPYFHNDLGMALLQLNNTDEAISHISEALRLLPSFGQAVGNLQFALRLRDGKK